VPAIVALSLLGATRTCDLHKPVYGLTADSTFTQGCFPPLLCPVAIGPDVGGTFRLIEVPQPELAPFQVYRVVDVYWLARYGGKDVPITGSGPYQIEGEFALQHRLQLDLRVGDEDVQSFDSGLVVADGAPFPAIDIRISIHGETFFDTVIDVRSIPFPPPPPDPTPCGPELLCDAETEICVRTTPIGPAVVHRCEPVPAGCEEDRTCGCADALCEAPFLYCTEPAVNTLECECLQCQ
jgi:hypothetical protein